MTARPTAAILAGGRSTRFSAAGGGPKALATVGGRTLLDHVVDRYVEAGHRAVVVVLGHHAEVVTGHLVTHGRHVDGSPGHLVVDRDDVRLHLVDTGLDTGTGARVGLAAEHLADRFHLAWCDGLLDVDPTGLEADHVARGGGITMVVAHPATRFGRVRLDGDLVTAVDEKPVLDDVWVSAGMFVVDRDVLPTPGPGNASWERDVLPRAAKDGHLHAHRHEGFWAAVDTPEDLARLRAEVGDTTPWRAGPSPR